MTASPIRIGFDEAGLGPTLGPLVVAGFATRERKSGARDQLRRRLIEVVGEPPCRDGRLEVGDSKAIHQGVHKLARLERTALATIGWIDGEIPTSVARLFDRVLVGEFELASDRRAPWWQTLDEPLPLAGDRGELTELAGRLRSAGERLGVEPLWYRADLIDAARVNRELDDEAARPGGTKNSWSTHAVLRMAALALRELDGPRAIVACDMCGGRRSYEQPLSRAFGLAGPGLFDRSGGGAITERSETRAACRYQLALPGREVELAFLVGGDQLDPRISWGSILAKYLRELLMRAFNRHFAAAVPDIRPTAGYPEDARRFIDDVEAALGVDGGLERTAWVRSK